MLARCFFEWQTLKARGVSQGEFFCRRVALARVTKEMPMQVSTEGNEGKGKKILNRSYRGSREDVSVSREKASNPKYPFGSLPARGREPNGFLGWWLSFRSEAARSYLRI
jgi:hypothetical protein